MQLVFALWNWKNRIQSLSYSALVKCHETILMLWVNGEKMSETAKLTNDACILEANSKQSIVFLWRSVEIKVCLKKKHGTSHTLIITLCLHCNKAWMCGGSIEIVPCSQVGHIFRRSSPIRWTKYIGRKNVIRVAEVWMDDYKNYFYEEIRYKLVREAKTSSFS